MFVLTFFNFYAKEPNKNFYIILKKKFTYTLRRVKGHWILLLLRYSRRGTCITQLLFSESFEEQGSDFEE